MTSARAGSANRPWRGAADERLARMHGQAAQLQGVTHMRAAIRLRTWDWLREAARRTVRRFGVAPLVVYGVAFAFYLAVGLILIAQLGVTGDEPWYLMLGYSLVHNHTADLAAIIHNPALYHTFTSHADDHTGDYLGNGERVLPNLPGYARSGSRTALRGASDRRRAGGGDRAAATLLLFPKGRRLFAARGGRLAASGLRPALPRPFPSAPDVPLLPLPLRSPSPASCSPRARSLPPVGVGCCSRRLAWVRSARYCPGCTSRRPGGPRAARPCAAATRIRAGVLPWHSVLRQPGNAARGGDHRGHHCPQLPADRRLLSPLLRRLDAAYSTAAGSGMDFARPNLPRALALYTDMFASNQSGLLPWVPLDFLVIPGAALLWRLSAQARAILVLIGAQFVGFLPVLFTPAIYQGYALPSRFTVESHRSSRSASRRCSRPASPRCVPIARRCSPLHRHLVAHRRLIRRRMRRV